MTDKPKRPSRDIKDLKAKLGLAKPGAKRSGGGAIPPPAGIVPPPGAGRRAAPQQGGGVVPPPGMSAPQAGGGVVPPAGYQQPQPQAQQQAPQAAGAAADIPLDDDFGSGQVHGKKELVFRILLGALAVIAFFIGTQCGKTTIIRGWVNKVTDDSKKIVSKLKVVNQSVRRLQALEKQLPLTKKRGGGMIETYSPEFGLKAETLVAPMEKMKEAEIFGIFYNMLKPSDQPVVGQLFLYFALLKQLRNTVIAMRSFEYRTKDILSVISKEGKKKLQEQRGATKFGAYYTGPQSVALAILEPKSARCGAKIDEKCGSKSPKGYVIDANGAEKTVSFGAEKTEEQLLNLNLGGMGGLANCFGGSTEVQRRLAQAKGAWQIYLQYRINIHKILEKIQAKAKPTEIYKVYEKYATRDKINRYVIF